MLSGAKRRVRRPAPPSFCRIDAWWAGKLRDRGFLKIVPGGRWIGKLRGSEKSGPKRPAHLVGRGTFPGVELEHGGVDGLRAGTTGDMVPVVLAGDWALGMVPNDSRLDIIAAWAARPWNCGGPCQVTVDKRRAPAVAEMRGGRRGLVFIGRAAVPVEAGNSWTWK